MRFLFLFLSLAAPLAFGAEPPVPVQVTLRNHPKLEAIVDAQRCQQDSASRETVCTFWVSPAAEEVHLTLSPLGAASFTVTVSGGFDETDPRVPQGAVNLLEPVESFVPRAAFPIVIEGIPGTQPLQTSLRFANAVKGRVTVTTLPGNPISTSVSCAAPSSCSIAYQSPSDSFQLSFTPPSPAVPLGFKFYRLSFADNIPWCGDAVFSVNAFLTCPFVPVAAFPALMTGVPAAAPPPEIKGRIVTMNGVSVQGARLYYAVFPDITRLEAFPTDYLTKEIEGSTFSLEMPRTREANARIVLAALVPNRYEPAAVAVLRPGDAVQDVTLRVKGVGLRFSDLTHVSPTDEPKLIFSAMSERPNGQVLFSGTYLDSLDGRFRIPFLGTVAATTGIHRRLRIEKILGAFHCPFPPACQWVDFRQRSISLVHGISPDGYILARGNDPTVDRPRLLVLRKVNTKWYVEYLPEQTMPTKKLASADFEIETHAISDANTVLLSFREQGTVTYQPFLNRDSLWEVPLALPSFLRPDNFVGSHISRQGTVMGYVRDGTVAYPTVSPGQIFGGYAVKGYISGGSPDGSVIVGSEHGSDGAMTAAQFLFTNPEVPRFLPNGRMLSAHDANDRKIIVGAPMAMRGSELRLWKFPPYYLPLNLKELAFAGGRNWPEQLVELSISKSGYVFIKDMRGYVGLVAPFYLSVSLP